MSAKLLPLPQAKRALIRTVREVQGARATGVREELQEREVLGAMRVWLRDLVHDSPSWLTSMLVHMVLLLVLALLSLPEAIISGVPQLMATDITEDPLEELPDLTIPEPLPDLTIEPASVESLVPDDLLPGGTPTPDPEVALDVEIGLLDEISKINLLEPVPSGPGTTGPGPGGPGKHRIGGFKEREHLPVGKAVALALKWLAEHQLPDGSWSFDHSLCTTCRGQCRNAGQLADARLGATGLALLPFLGAGQTHKEGKYQMTVKRGLYFLVTHMKLDTTGGSFYEPGGRMYSHGIAAIALCEAYAMTRDKGLYAPAQQAVKFICYAQDPVGGGWRYEPHQPGDTSVVGWQIMALKSAHMAYLIVPPETISRAFAYLDGVQYESGAKYGYTKAGQGSSATTAIGLLCRMYLGWKKDNPALERGVQWLSQQGPAPGDMYYNYYATQVMRHWDGTPWDDWDAVMKPQLINSQAKAGHETGSWYFKHQHADRGGRLYCTAMAAMTLEVYYRALPIYGEASVDDDFVL